MKNKLTKIFLFIILSISFVSLTTVPSIIKADSGFDADYDYGGGSYDSWGSYDDDDDDYYYGGGYYDNDNYSSGGGSADMGIILLALLLSFTPPIIIGLCVHFANKRRSQSVPLIDTSWMSVDDDLNVQAFLLYKQVQEAWMNQDLDSVRHLLTDEMYNMYLMQLDTLIEQGQVNKMENILFVSGHVARKRNYKGIETIVMILRVTCRDYIVNDKNKVIRGKKNAICDYTYELKFVRNSRPKTINCPSCGATIKNEDGVVCPHCSSIVHTHTDTLRLADKKMLRQTRR